MGWAEIRRTNWKKEEKEDKTAMAEHGQRERSNGAGLE
jgi:hypothetical protein